MKIAIGSDHAGYEYKEKICAHFKDITFLNKGTDSKESVDYPDIAHPVALSVTNQETELGILICGSANGVAITANKHQNIRAGIAWYPELARLTRQHNNANIICIPARFVSLQQAIDIVETFIKTPFEGGRHTSRVNKISC